MSRNRFSATSRLLATAFVLLIAACKTVEIPTNTIGAPAPQLEASAPPRYQLLYAEGETATPFMPIPVTGTPPPSSTPAPTPLPSPTPSATPWLHPAFAPPSVPSYGIPAPFPLLSPDQHINFLLLGSDSRGGGSYRTDVLIIVMVDPIEKLVTLISLPRDLYVYIPGWTMNRINTAYLHGENGGSPGGGMALIKETIRYNLGIRIDHVALVDFDGFRRIVDAAGGIDVPVVCPFTEWTVIDPTISIEYVSNWELITIGPGVVHMDGDTALWYARARMRSNDFDRGRRQQEVMRAMFKAAVAGNLILQAPQLYEDYRETITSDIDLQSILSLVPLGLELNEAQIRSYYVGDALTWGWTTPGGASVLLPNAEKIYAMLLEAIAPPQGLPPEDKPIIEIRNGSSRVDLDVLAAERLHYAGYETVILPPVEKGAQETMLYDLSDMVDQDSTGSLLELLGLSGSQLLKEPQAGAEASFRLVLGDDYVPCFNPAVP